ncbi:MAG: alanine--tRNA ligase [Bacilli bacterium]
MKRMTSKEIRNMWFKFFSDKGHTIIPSAPLVPINDNSLLWINAGVAPLKKYFDGSVIPENKRLVNIQKCIRTNDIENVGITKRHLTYFEMMGNFSIGDYFKDQAIEYAFELLTSPSYFAIPLDKLYFTVYSEDLDTYNKWISLGVDSSHIAKLEGNFWEIGEGPCGPDSEIFYDRGEKYDVNNTALDNFFKDLDQERYIEIWNNVFSQFNSKEGVSRNKYKELPSKNIDTGAGLERWACIFNDLDSPFDTDLFSKIMNDIEIISGIKYEGQTAFKVIADHIRAITFALSDGAIFENVGRGYVLRRLLRRSVRFAKKINIYEPFMHKLVEEVVETMKDIYPDLVNKQAEVKALILQEEELFHKTLLQGEKKLETLIKNASNKEISGYDTFKLYDTYGFPYELTLEYLEEVGYTTNKEEFDKYMNEQKIMAKAARKEDSKMNIQNQELLNFNKSSEFIYNNYEISSNVIGLIEDEKFVNSLDSNGFIILKRTNMYATCGGQVNDIGFIFNNEFTAKVIDVTKLPNGSHLHKIELLQGVINLNDDCISKIDEERRLSIERNHSTAHLVQQVLRELISDKVTQAGSRIDEFTCRFDFNCTNKISEEDIINIENRLNELINLSLNTVTVEMSLKEAKDANATALFGEKYGQIVRTVRMGDSFELCGGTHVRNTKDIKKIAILNLESKGSNLYRIELATANNIESELLKIIDKYKEEMLKLITKYKEILLSAKELEIKLDFDIILEDTKADSYKAIIFYRNMVLYLQKEVANLEKTFITLKNNKLTEDLSSYEKDIVTKDTFKYLILKTNNLDQLLLKEITDKLFEKIEVGLILIANINDTSANYICKSNISLSAGDVVKDLSLKTLGSGGGSPNFARGGGRDISNLDNELLDIKKQLNSL